MSSINNHKKNQALYRPSSVSSLHSTCLDNLRFSKKKEKATHLLAYMSECIEDKQEVQVQQAQQLCCYDRMKRLILNSNSFVDQKDLQNKLSKALLIESKINGLQKSYNKLNEQNQKKYQNMTKKKTHNYVSKKSIIEELKEKSYDKFISMYRNNREQQSHQFKIQIEKDIQNKINKILEARDTNHMKVLHENVELKRVILQKNLEIERIKTQLIHLKQHKIQDVSEKQPEQICNKITQSQQWLQQFKENFPNMSIEDVHKKMQNMKNSCLVKFDWVYHQQQKQYKEQKENLVQSIQNLKQNIKNIEQRENKLTENYQKLKEENQVLKRKIIYIQDSEGKIKMYEKTIQSLYSQWYKHLHQSEKKMMKTLGHFKQDYNYREMLEYIVNYCKKFNSNGKLNEYIIKILRGIQKLRRVVFPKQSNQKLDPFLTVQKLQHWIKRRVLLQEKSNTNNIVKKTAVDNQIQYLQEEMS